MDNGSYAGLGRDTCLVLSTSPVCSDVATFVSMVNKRQCTSHLLMRPLLRQTVNGFWALQLSVIPLDTPILVLLVYKPRCQTNPEAVISCSGIVVLHVQDGSCKLASTTRMQVVLSPIMSIKESKQNRTESIATCLLRVVVAMLHSLLVLLIVLLDRIALCIWIVFLFVGYQKQLYRLIYPHTDNIHMQTQMHITHTRTHMRYDKIASCMYASVSTYDHNHLLLFDPERWMFCVPRSCCCCCLSVCSLDFC